jgi:hypothetical protein
MICAGHLTRAATTAGLDAGSATQVMCVHDVGMQRSRSQVAAMTGNNWRKESADVLRSGKE